MDENGNFTPPFIVYKDKYHLPMTTTAEFIEEFRKMEVRDDDVFIVTYPKSGTHWMQELVNLIFADGDPEKLTSNDRLPVVEMANVPKIDMVAEGVPVFRLMKDFPSPRVFTTHVQCAMLPEQIWRKKCKVIYVSRNPKDVIVSSYNFHLKIYEKFASLTVPDIPKHFDSFFHALLVGNIEYGNWFDHVLEYSPNKDKDFFHFVSYEEMKQDISSVVKRVSEFLGRDIDEETVQKVVDGSSFATMKKSYEKDHRQNLANGKKKMPLDIFMHAGKTNQWKTRFTREQNEEFDQTYRRKMKDCQLTRNYDTAGMERREMIRSA